MVVMACILIGVTIVAIVIFLLESVYGARVDLRKEKRKPGNNILFHQSNLEKIDLVLWFQFSDSYLIFNTIGGAICFSDLNFFENSTTIYFSHKLKLAFVFRWDILVQEFQLEKVDKCRILQDYPFVDLHWFFEISSVTGWFFHFKNFSLRIWKFHFSSNLIF